MHLTGYCTQPLKWHCPPDTGLEIWALAVWGRARYLSVTEAPHNIESLQMSGEGTFCYALKLKGQNGVRTRDLLLSKPAALTTAIKLQCLYWLLIELLQFSFLPDILHTGKKEMYTRIIFYKRTFWWFSWLNHKRLPRFFLTLNN